MVKQWFFGNMYTRFDITWIAFGTYCIAKDQVLFGFIVLTIGIFISSFIEILWGRNET